ncbi:MAG: EthD domain-containing protein [Chloroflexi bacterium]|nr:EthD domain-containing protein [Chloroflexota bacterium]
MIKMVYCLRRRPELSREEFQRYWRETHAPLVQKYAQALNLRRYVQVHTSEHPVNDALRESRGAMEPYDGVAELWWDSADSMATAMASAEGRKAGQALLEDEKRFIDVERSALWIGQEHAFVER